MSNDDGVKIDIESPEQFEEDVSKIIEEEEEKKKSAAEPDDEAVKEDKPEPEREADENQ